MKLNRIIPFLAFVFLLSACSFTLAADVTPPPGYQPPPPEPTQVSATSGPVYPLIPPDPTKGAAIYVEKCAPCHGPSGLGDGSNADQLPNPVTAIGSLDVARQATPAQWFQVVTQGNLERFMPPFPSLTDRERWDVVAYAFSLSTTPESVDLGAELYRANCEKCHGENGSGDGPEASVRMPDFADQEYMAKKSAADLYEAVTNGHGDNMPAFGENLSDTERLALAAFIRYFTFPSTNVADVIQETPSSIETPEAAVQPTDVISDTQVITGTEPVGVISGFVMNASGGDVPGGLPVILHGFDQMQIVLTDTIELSNDGSFLFQDIEMPVGRVFLATIDFDGITYGSQIATVEAESNALDLPIQVYETTTDSSVLSVDRVHFFFEFIDDQTVRVVELYIISNPTMETLIGSEEGAPTLTFTLPEQASNLQFEDGELGERFITTPEGFGDTLPIRPGMGNYQILFSYDMPYDRKLELSRPMSLNANAVVILVPEDNVKVKGENIQDAGTRNAEGMEYHMYTGGPQQAGDNLSLTITGSPASNSPMFSSGSTTSLVIGLSAIGIVLILAGVWLFRRKPVSGEDELADGEMEVQPGVPEDNPDAIMDAILALDDLYKDGELPEEAYKQRRAELKARLRELLDQ